MKPRLMMIFVIKGPGRRSNGALTFIEILIAVVILVILASGAMPNLRTAITNVQLDTSAQQLQAFMDYLRQRSIIDGKVVILNIDGNEFLAKFREQDAALRKYSVPGQIKTESDKPEVFFYPDGRIDAVEIVMTAKNNYRRVLTTKGIYGAVKLLPKEKE